MPATQLSTLAYFGRLSSSNEVEDKRAVVGDFAVFPEVNALPGAKHQAASVWRIGLMGHNARLSRVDMVLGALRRILGR